MRNFSHFHRCLLNHPLTRWSLLKNFSYLWKFFLQFHDRGGPGSWRQPQCWENFKISLQLFVPSFFRSCLEVRAPAFLKQSFFTFQINISLYFSSFCCVFCPFLLLFQLQGIWSSLSRRFTPRHAPTRLPCASNSFSALKLEITTSFLSFSHPIVFVQVVFFLQKSWDWFSVFVTFPHHRILSWFFADLSCPPGRLAGTPHSVIQFSPRNDFPSLFVHPRCAGTFANGATKTTNK